MRCMDCDNTKVFYELNQSADAHYFKDDGTLDYIDAGEHYFEGWECPNCGSRDVRE